MRQLLLILLFINSILLNAQQNKAQTNDKVAIESKGFVCSQGGFNIQLRNFDDGTASVSFYGSGTIYMDVSEITSWSPFNPYSESYVKKQAPVEPNQVCLKTGFYVSPRDYYYTITKGNRNPWSSTIAVYVQNVPIDLSGFTNPSEVLNIYKSKLENVSNGGAIPSSCSDALGCSHQSGSNGGNADLVQQGNTRFSIADLMADAPWLDTYDAIRLWKGESSGWGDSVEDVRGLSSSWLNVLNNLGIINGAAIKAQVMDQTPQYGLILKKISTPSLDFLCLEPIEEGEDPPVIILPKLNIPAFLAGQCLSFPSCMYIPQTTNKYLPGGQGRDGGPNPDYCEQNDPTSESYIPMYVTNSDILLELFAEVEYLTYDQLDLIQEKGVDIFNSFNNLRREDRANTIAENPAKNRIQYDCVLVDNSAAGKSMGLSDITDVNGVRYNEQCKIKDKAYYDALIEKMIIVNPMIRDVKNHPCNKPKIQKANMNIHTIKKNKAVKF